MLPYCNRTKKSELQVKKIKNKRNLRSKETVPLQYGKLEHTLFPMPFFNYQQQPIPVSQHLTSTK